MTTFSYQQDILHAEKVSLFDIAQVYGTPTYVYSKAALTRHYQAYANMCGQYAQGKRTLIAYAVKSNSNLAVLQQLAQLGAGFDIVSGGELLRVLAVGGDPQRVIFSGVGKTREEMHLALSHDILCFNIESMAELHALSQIAQQMQRVARISMRVNPDIDAQTHPYISTGLKENKFGIAYGQALASYRLAATLPYLEIVGLDCHIGSQLLTDAPLLAALDKMLHLIDMLAKEKIEIRHLDMGGGLGIVYRDEEPVLVSAYLSRLFSRIIAWQAAHPHYRTREALPIFFEPGRSITGNAGILLTEIQYIKPGELKHFAIVDAAMNDLLRPALYDAWHGVWPVKKCLDPVLQDTYDIVGPVCETGDWLARARRLAVKEGDLLAILSAGAYGMTMASNYNTRARIAEVMVDGDQHFLIRQRERWADLFAGEFLLPTKTVTAPRAV